MIESDQLCREWSSDRLESDQLGRVKDSDRTESDQLGRELKAVIESGRLGRELKVVIESDQLISIKSKHTIYVIHKTLKFRHNLLFSLNKSVHNFFFPRNKICHCYIRQYDIPGPILIIRHSLMRANKVVVKWTVPSSATGMFIRISFCKGISTYTYINNVYPKCIQVIFNNAIKISIHFHLTVTLFIDLMKLWAADWKLLWWICSIVD